MQAGGQRFESVILHIFPVRASGGPRGKSIFDLLAHKTVVKTKVKKIKAIRIKRAVTARGRRYAIRRAYHVCKYKICCGSASEVCQGARWMPWLTEAMKDAISCDKLRAGANDL